MDGNTIEMEESTMSGQCQLIEEVIDQGICVACGACGRVCPVETMNEFNDQERGLRQPGVARNPLGAILDSVGLVSFK